MTTRWFEVLYKYSRNPKKGILSPCRVLSPFCFRGRQEKSRRKLDFALLRANSSTDEHTPIRTCSEMGRVNDQTVGKMSVEIYFVPRWNPYPLFVSPSCHKRDMEESRMTVASRLEIAPMRVKPANKRKQRPCHFSRQVSVEKKSPHTG